MVSFSADFLVIARCALCSVSPTDHAKIDSVYGQCLSVVVCDIGNGIKCRRWVDEYFKSIGECGELVAGGGAKVMLGKYINSI